MNWSAPLNPPVLRSRNGLGRPESACWPNRRENPVSAADLKHAIIAGTLRSVAAVDFRRAEAVPLEGLDDPLVLAAAATEGRVLVSHDVNTMERHFRQFIQRQGSPGLILIPQKRITVRQAIEGLVLIWEVLDAADLDKRVCLLPSLVIY